MTDTRTAQPVLSDERIAEIRQLLDEPRLQGWTWYPISQYLARDLLSVVDRLSGEQARLKTEYEARERTIEQNAQFALAEVRAQLAQAEQDRDIAQEAAAKWRDDLAKETVHSRRTLRVRAEQAEAERTALQARLTRLESALVVFTDAKETERDCDETNWNQFKEPVTDYARFWDEQLTKAGAALSPAEDARCVCGHAKDDHGKTGTCLARGRGEGWTYDPCGCGEFRAAEDAR